ncbi:hypothetical protein PATSB16_42060 [Pandoraea thiooxydans]|uniref:YggT family protein n=1 Tax=Pandoraea thiooxydans TaxID=445709 RepID=A0A0G3EWK0_9BURK|nr:YggT family protein [Pandoraea thiooxydans]AKJ69782.1 hypothetical protein ABW99_17805 [Pandoraea thiooxydans]APR97540.1 hypothetical protein PATSB16_42060 [Pandoraea thiooxydans]
MFGEIARFLIDTIFTLFGAVLLLRAWMQVIRMPPGNPISRGVFQVTDWLVLPLRRILPGYRGIDWASLVAAYLTALVFLVLMVAAVGGQPALLFPLGLLIALLTLVKWALNLLMWLTLLMAVMSWVNPHSPAMPVLDYLTTPFLRPIRRVLPPIGGADLSPLALFLIIQVLLMLLARGGFLLFGM